MSRKTVLSGIRATGKLHLGNYLGAVQHFVRLTQMPDTLCMYFIADLHTLTTLPDPVMIRQNLPEIVLDYLAAGVDPSQEHNIIFAQSSVPETSELFWLLCNLISVGTLHRSPSFKDKVSKSESRDEIEVNAGLLNYPVLMAADILGPKATMVPVGDDQRPHLEMAADIAERFNRKYGELFPVPQPMDQPMIRVPGLDGTEKMGKSEGNSLNLTDTPDEIRAKMMRAPTDMGPADDPGQMSQGVQNLFTLLELTGTPEQYQEYWDRYRNGELMYGKMKPAIAECVIELLRPFQARRKEIAADPTLVQRTLVEGGKRAREIIAGTVNEALQRVGVGSYR